MLYDLSDEEENENNDEGENEDFYPKNPNIWKRFSFKDYFLKKTTTFSKKTTKLLEVYHSDDYIFYELYEVCRIFIGFI